MIDFSTLQGVAIPEGVVTQIESGGVVLWAVQGNKPIFIEVEKITSNTYAGETSYSSEQFILLDIYPKTNGTVSVTYGGLTKTITDTSGAANPNAQQVYFGTFNGVSDSVATPASGALVIEGDCRGVGCGSYQTGSKSTDKGYCNCITAVNDLGKISYIPSQAFYHCDKIERIILPDGIGLVSGGEAFCGCNGLKHLFLPKSFSHGITNLFNSLDINNPIVVDPKNTKYVVDGNCLIDVGYKSVIAGFLDSVIPSYVKAIGAYAFHGRASLKSIVIPASVTKIGGSSFSGCSGLKSIVIPASVTEIGMSAFYSCSGLESITFENTEGWVIKPIGGDEEAVDVSDPAQNVSLLNTSAQFYRA